MKNKTKNRTNDAAFPITKPLLLGLLVLACNAWAGCNDEPQAFVDWRGCAKPSANLVGAVMPSGNLESIDLQYAFLNGANLERAHLAGANLQYAHLDNANLQYADLWHANLRETELKGAQLTGATWTDGRRCGPGSVGTCK
ncbi:MAG: pentapeptide repeat-containing protein [Burkholderiaceae bacterium]